MAPAEAPVLSFKSVTKIYRRSHLGKTYLTRGIEGLDLEVAPKEVFGLVGLNGSGKTTTFKLASGILSCDSGAIAVFGLPPSHPGALSRIGYLPELPYFYPFLTPHESLRFYGRLSGLSGRELEDRIRDALAKVGLAARADKRLGELSKGLLQRVGLAQTLIHDPLLLILDEPASGLDPLATKDFRDYLTDLKSRGKTILISSHSIPEIEKLCDRVGILKEGKLARTVSSREWVGRDGGLESLFLEIIR